MEDTYKRAHGKLRNVLTVTEALISNQKRENVCEDTVHDAMSSYIDPPLIDKDLHECQNVSINFLCAILCVFHLEISSFFIRVIPFIPLFVCSFLKEYGNEYYLLGNALYLKHFIITAMS